MKDVKGRNGGTIKQAEKGETANPNGRPKGTQNFKTVLQKLLDAEITVTEAGQKLKISTREALLMKMVRDALTSDDPNVRLRATSFIADRTDGKPTQSVITTETTPAKFEAWLGGDGEWNEQSEDEQ